MKNFDWSLIGIITLLVILFSVLFLAVVETTHERERLMAQCMADGKKEYECHAMLDKPEAVYQMVTPIYVGH